MPARVTRSSSHWNAARRHDDDRPREECGVFGVFGHVDAAALTHLALFALQHRGQESAGIAASDGRELYHHRGMGLVGEAIPPHELARLQPGSSAIGHVRYSTTGSSLLANAQPLVFNFQRGNMALAHNGNLINAHLVRGRMESAGAIFQTSSDTEVVAHLVARAGTADFAANIRAALGKIVGAYAFCILTDDRLFAMRDPNGLRPMVLGKVDGAWCVASESCALDTIGAELVRDVEPGEMLEISCEGLVSSCFARPQRRALCTFEHIYFARPDSEIDGHNVHLVRKEFGRQLWSDHPAQADVVIGVPDSSLSSAMGYAEASGLPYEMGLVKSRYVGRTFIEPTAEKRINGVRLKLSAVRRVVEGRRVVMVDDSLVRGTTAARIVELLRERGAREVHLRIASPPVAHACHYGIDTSARGELVAAELSVEGIRAKVGADTLGFLGEASMMRAFGAQPGEPHGFCNACFHGRYPTDVFEGASKRMLELVRA